MSIYEIFETLAENPSRNFKLDFLGQHKDNVTLREVIRLALDPFTQFYIRKIPEYQQIGNTDITIPEALGQLSQLSNRFVTGHKGIEHLRNILSNLPLEKAKIIEKVIAKDLRCGVSVSTANKVWPGLIKEYPVMLCSGYEEKLVNKIPFPAYVQLKLDGMRFNAIVRSGDVEFRSRSGKEIELLGFLVEEFRAMAGDVDTVFDGELTVKNKNGDTLNRQTGNGILNKASRGTISPEEADTVHATIWDAIPYLYFQDGEYNRAYSERFDYVKNCVEKLDSERVSCVPNTVVNDAEEANKVFTEYYESGEEGIILKDVNGIWEDKRSKHQIKYKGELECDLKIVGLEDGTGKYQGLLGALLVESADGILKVSVGSGLTDEDRAILNSTTILGKIIAVKYNARIKNKQGEDSLFLPIFVELREDKTEADMAKDIK